MDNQNKSGREEIDLFEIINRIGKAVANLITAIFEYFLKFLVFLIKKSPIILGFVLLGILYGFYKYKTEQRYFESSMVATSNAIPNSDMIEYINKLHELSRENNKEALSELLKMDSSTVADLKDIQAFWIIDQNKDSIGDYVDFNNKHNPYDTTNVRMKDRFHVRMQLFDNKTAKQIRQGIYNYLESNDYINKLNEKRLEHLRKLAETYQYEIEKLDSLQKMEYYHRNMAKGNFRPEAFVMMNEERTQLYYGNILFLLKEKQKIETELSVDTAALTIIEDFTPLSQPENEFIDYAKINGAMFFVLGIIAAGILTHRKRILKYIREN